MKKLVILFLFVKIVLFAEEFEEIEKFTLDNVKHSFFTNSVIKKGKYFYTVNYTDRKIIIFDKTGNIIKETGGKGKGPGEFQYLYNLSIFKDTLFVSDYGLYRLSKFDKNLNFLESFFIKRGYQDFITSHKNEIIMIGNNWKYLDDQLKEYSLGLVYQKNNYGNYEFKKRIIPVKKFPNIKTFLGSNSNFKSFIGFPAIEATRIDDNLYIVFNLLDYVIKYDLNSGKITKFKINFPTYINPFEINYKKIKKILKKEKNILVDPINTQFAPVFIAYNKLSQHFIIQYNRPYLERKNSKNKSYFITVIFDKNFHYVDKFYTDYLLSGLYYENSKAFILACKAYQLFLKQKPDDFDDENTHFIIYRINEK